jgi:hypothetical protein
VSVTAAHRDARAAHGAPSRQKIVENPGYADR